MTSDNLQSTQVFLQWVSLNAGKKVQSISEFKDGKLLGQVMKRLVGTELPSKLGAGTNKLQMMGNLSVVLKFIGDQGLRVTCSAEGITRSFNI